MRRRGKRGPNNSESTGKVGQELPKYADNQPIPLRPEYPEDGPAEPAEAAADDESFDDAGDLAGEAGDATGAGAEPANVAGDGAQERTGRRRRRRRRKGGKPEASANPASTSAAGFDPSVSPAADDAGSDEDGHGVEGDGSEDAGDEEPVGDLQASSGAPGRVVHETQPERLETPPAQAPSVAPRTPRGFVVLAIGLPGSGKTTWFKRRGVMPLSSDMLRSILFDDITEQRYQGLVFSTLRSLLRARLVAKMPWNYVDATNLSPHERRQWIKMAKSFGYDVQAVFFDVPVEVCLMRNQKRERRVSDETITAMALRLRPPHFREGFSKITVVRVKPKGGEPSLTEAPDAAFSGGEDAGEGAANEAGSAGES